VLGAFYDEFKPTEYVTEIERVRRIYDLTERDKAMFQDEVPRQLERAKLRGGIMVNRDLARPCAERCRSIPACGCLTQEK
jgi:hypothetical protein